MRLFKSAVNGLKTVGNVSVTLLYYRYLYKTVIAYHRRPVSLFASYLIIIHTLKDVYFSKKAFIHFISFLFDFK